MNCFVLGKLVRARNLHISGDVVLVLLPFTSVPELLFLRIHHSYGMFHYMYILV